MPPPSPVPAGAPPPGRLKAALAALLAAAASQPAPAETGPVRAEVLKVFDGDTLLARVGRREAKVRLVGVDCPEVSHPSRALEFYGEESAAFVRGLAEGKSVTLGADPQGDDRDTYDRLLRYVTLPDGRLLNTLLIEEGYCYALTRFAFSRGAEFSRLEEAARRRGGRLWEDGGLAEIRWLERQGALPFAVYPMTRRTWGARFGDRVRVRMSGRELLRALDSARAAADELGARDLDLKLEREGWKRLPASR